jgi:inosine-uridine nucleoside N-ribohydrolase
MQFPGPAKPPTGIVFDSAMDKIDDALALALLHGFEGRDEARIAAIAISSSNLKAAQFCDAVRIFYAGPAGPGAGSVRGLPVGLAEGRSAGASAMLSAPVRATVVKSLNDTADVTTVIRNALTAQYDRNAAAVLSGPATNLAKLLDMYGAKDLIAHKVKVLSMAAGAFPDGPPEPNIRAHIAAARRIFAEWPTPIVAAGYEIGTALRFPAASIEKDFAWSATHPIVDAYRAYRPMPYDAPTWAMAALLYAVRPAESYFQLSEPGTVTVRDDGRTQFTASAEGKHRYLILDPDRRERIIRTYIEIASAKPVERKKKLAAK